MLLVQSLPPTPYPHAAGARSIQDCAHSSQALRSHVAQLGSRSFLPTKEDIKVFLGPWRLASCPRKPWNFSSWKQTDKQEGRHLHTSSRVFPISKWSPHRHRSPLTDGCLENTSLLPDYRSCRGPHHLLMGRLCSCLPGREGIQGWPSTKHSEMLNPVITWGSDF